MRVAALYDIHGNLPALEAVLQELHALAVDRIVIGGDVVPGPMPREACDLLRSLDLPVQFIQGNGDRVVRARMAGRDSDEVPDAYRGVIRWVAEQLRPEHEQWFAGWSLTLRLAVPGLGDVLFCHATPRNDRDIFTQRTPEERLLPVFEGVGAPLVVCGHTHIQFDRTVGPVRVVNAGSVGMPFAEPGAYWLLLGPGIELRRTSYDLERAAERVRATAYPQAEDFAARNILQPPSEASMVEIFARAELK